ncbi:putative cyclase [Wolfiporia cocos MD-104 SS10]|uniref:Putative cyclase n=1 Tax=Wolfiporia cocos (strain MD-104) TaxID=742152 RepID=A0A2H3J0L7_WOLCO|nr:putative cyclase [Wolfiporia cocos MD-104 SS10]
MQREHVVIDLTHPLVPNGVPACLGHPSYNAELTFKLADGDFANVHTLTLGSHTGTHIDAPYHFFLDGCTVDNLDLRLLAAAPAVVVDLRLKKAHEPIRWEDLEKHAHRMRRGVAVLLCTGWSRRFGQQGYSDHPFLELEAARRILDAGVRVIGADTLSPDEFTEEGDTGQVHRLVLGSGGVIVENLNNLGQVLDKGWEDVRVSVLPLRLSGVDGSPVRAVVWNERPVAATSIND